MDTAIVITEGDRQVVQLPKGYRLLTSTVTIRQEGENIVLEPVKLQSWPPGFFEEIHIKDQTFERPAQGSLPEINKL
jgi:virulence-associated protein VagC